MTSDVNSLWERERVVSEDRLVATGEGIELRASPRQMRVVIWGSVSSPEDSRHSWGVKEEVVDEVDGGGGMTRVVGHKPRRNLALKWLFF